LESFYAARSIDKFLFARKKRMAFRADFKMDFRLCRAGLESLAASASYGGLNVIGMYVCLHGASSDIWLRAVALALAAARQSIDYIIDGLKPLSAFAARY
jgi:hypothetical protein